MARFDIRKRPSEVSDQHAPLVNRARFRKVFGSDARSTSCEQGDHLPFSQKVNP